MAWAVPACWRWECLKPWVWQQFRPGPDQSPPPELLIQNRHSLNFFFSCSYFSFRCFELSNLFMYVAGWVQTIKFFFKLLIHISYENFFFQIKCTSSLILWQKNVTEYCFISMVKKSALSMLLLNGSWSGPPKDRSFYPTEPVCKSDCSFALLGGFILLHWHGIEMMNFFFGFLMLQTAGLLRFQLCCFCWKM